VTARHLILVEDALARMGHDHTQRRLDSLGGSASLIASCADSRGIELDRDEMRDCCLILDDRMFARNIEDYHREHASRARR
jgi:hypothetical protein